MGYEARVICNILYTILILSRPSMIAFSNKLLLSFAARELVYYKWYKTKLKHFMRHAESLYLRPKSVNTMSEALLIKNSFLFVIGRRKCCIVNAFGD